jgi:hypothetical protein
MIVVITLVFVGGLAMGASGGRRKKVSRGGTAQERIEAAVRRVLETMQPRL